jgi:hypothetical protein
MTFYWVLTPSGEGLDGSEIPQATFTAVREYHLMQIIDNRTDAYHQKQPFSTLSALR